MSPSGDQADNAAYGGPLARRFQLEDVDDRSLDVSAVLQQAVVAALEVLPVTGMGLMLVDEGQVLRFVASSDKPGRILEDAQEGTGIGPCVDCLILDRVVATSQVQDDARWPGLRPEILDTPVRAVLAVPVRLSGGAVGALDAYADAVRDWTEAEIAALQAYAGMIGNLLAVNLARRRSDALVEQLQHALHYRVVIERGVGYLMARDAVDAVTAFNALRSAARSSRRKIVDVAADLLAGKSLP